MAQYNIYPAVDSEYRFPPEVRQAIAGSEEISASVEIGIANTVTPTIVSTVNTYIGSNPAIINAASTAATNAVNTVIIQKDLVGGEDPRLLNEVNTFKYATPFSDEDGYIAGGFLDDGSWNTEVPPRVNGASGMVARPITPQGWTYVECDEDGYVCYGIKESGEVYAPQINFNEYAVGNITDGMTVSNRKRVSCFGDSLTNGYFDGSSGHTTDAYPAKLQALMPSDVQVFNVSTSGWCVDEVAVRIGAISVPLTISGDTIPESGSVSAVTTAVIGFRSLNKTVNFIGTLAGVPGTLARYASDTVFTFIRATPGSAVSVAPGTKFIPDQLGYDADTTVILLGRNDISQGVSGIEATVGEHIVEGVQRIVDWHSRQLKRILVLPPPTNTSEVIGTNGYDTVAYVTQELTRRFPTKFYDLRKYLVTKAIYDLGITPTTTDLAKMAGDTLPPSIMDPGDGTHWSRATAALVAIKVNEFFTQRNWV